MANIAILRGRSDTLRAMLRGRSDAAESVILRACWTQYVTGSEKRDHFALKRKF